MEGRKRRGRKGKGRRLLLKKNGQKRVREKA